MERITKEAFEALSLKRTGMKTMESSPAVEVYKSIDMLLTDEALVVKHEEWPLKNMPANSSLPNKLRTLGRTYIVRTLADESGFVVKRTA